MTLFQAFVVNNIVNVLGVDFYVYVISSVILLFSLITFIVFKIWLFKEE